VPSRKSGERLHPGDVIGTVDEHRFKHKIMLPFAEPGDAELISIQGGEFTINDTVARIRDAAGRQRDLTIAQRWPVRRPLPEKLVRRGLCERLYPTEPLSTTIRLIDTFFPIALGGTACIPGPFGAGKTVLQGLIARFSTADVVIQVACGERAGEVLETIQDFGSMKDPRGGLLMDRTIVICNTSSMPVAAREASIYMGITLGEYYRQMGLHVLLIADSTSRWAQAMRETSGRLEEIPGEEGFPAYLDSSIKDVYERAGVLKTNDGCVGSLTMIGTVSPAGGNFEEPVTQSTLGTVKTFLGLSSARAYKRYYPAVDPLISWSRYQDQLHSYFEKHLRPGWTDSVRSLSELLHQGDNIYQMMQVTGEEGITIQDYVTYQKSLLLDMVYLQQDAFDKVDASTTQERQKDTFELVRRLIQRDYPFKDKEEARKFFTELTRLMKNLNYAAQGSKEYAAYLTQVEDLAKTLGRTSTATTKTPPQPPAG
jgi:V/A-type H+-transporting ATPase subunit A